MSTLLPLLFALTAPPVLAQEGEDPEGDEPAETGRERSEPEDESERERSGAPPSPSVSQSSVFVSEFQPRDEGSAAFASLLRSYLAEELLNESGVEVIEVDDAPDFGEHSALIYLQSCPPGDYVGCALVVGQRVEADYAVTGTVTETARGNRVGVSVIDVPDSREALSFSLEVEVGDDQVFIGGVVELLLAVIEGETGLVEDIRDEDLVSEERAEQRAINSQLADQLGQLKDELGDISEVGDLRGKGIDRPRYTLDDLSDDLESEGVKPWERLEMTATEYLRYKNSGKTLFAWRQAAMGRKNRLFLRPAVGFTRGLVDSEYYARYALESSALSSVESYAWQSAVTGSGFLFGGWAGFGLTPTLEVEVGAGGTSGRYLVEVHQDIVALSDADDPNSPYQITLEDTREGEDYAAGTFWTGARVLAGLFPVSPVRPVVGGGISYTWMSSTPVQLPTEVPSFEPNTLLQAQALGGVEAELGRYVDFYAWIPFSFLVGGRVSDEADSGLDIYTTTESPPVPPLASVAVELGVAVKLFGKKIENSGAREFDLEDY